MGTIWVKEFTGGLDTRRLPVTTTAGVLVRANNGHINRGGEFEKRAAFVPWHTAADTVGQAAGADGVYTFGHTTRPVALHADVLYQQLEHPTLPAQAVVKLLCAELHSAKLYVAVEFANGDQHLYYDGDWVSDWSDEAARGSVTVKQINPNSGTPALNGLWVGDTALISAPLTWNSNAVQTADDLKDAINAYTGTSGYSATVDSAKVTIKAETVGSEPNGLQITWEGENKFALIEIAHMSGGSLDPLPRGTFLKTADDKVYAVSGKILYFSGIAAPTKWTTDNVGAGFIDMGARTSQGEALTALSRYQSYLAVFAKRTIIIEYIDPDPTLNRVIQTLRNTGTRFPNSVTEFGDNDVFYADTSGLRSLQSRTNTDAAATADTGVPVDPLISAKLASISEDDAYRIKGLIEPRTGNFWLIVEDTIYVFALYRGAKINAWTTYTPSYFDGDDEIEFDVDYASVYDDKVYIRSDDQLFIFGGEDALDPTYDATETDAWLPYMDANKPAQKKAWNSLDAAVEGLWTLRYAMNPNNEDAADGDIVVPETTYGDGAIPLSGQSTHLSVRASTRDPKAAKLSSLVIVFDNHASEDS